ncbi:hypothetical protein NPIL_481961 [Nephila pilipes]|uniref:Uncharacterized protein n=1 Tax=Nephila pilipes TaxID=299642 RepID=A0A8X6UCB0_NEPPI|nr:hypothetical protein NPIL_481961 [Nephila pilipes]
MSRRNKMWYIDSLVQHCKRDNKWKDEWGAIALTVLVDLPDSEEDNDSNLVTQGYSLISDGKGFLQVDGVSPKN